MPVTTQFLDNYMYSSNCEGPGVYFYNVNKSKGIPISQLVMFVWLVAMQDPESLCTP